MTDNVYVTDISPVLFIHKLVEKIKEGYYVTDTVTGIPTLDLINEVELTKTDKPSQRNDFSELEKVHVASYSDLLFLLDIQDAVLQGFEIIEGTFEIAPPHAPHTVWLERAEPKVAVADVKPVTAVTGVEQKAKAGRPPKSKVE